MGRYSGIQSIISYSEQGLSMWRISLVYLRIWFWKIRFSRDFASNFSRRDPNKWNLSDWESLTLLHRLFMTRGIKPASEKDQRSILRYGKCTLPIINLQSQRPIGQINGELALIFQSSWSIDFSWFHARLSTEDEGSHDERYGQGEKLISKMIDLRWGGYCRSKWFRRGCSTFFKSPMLGWYRYKWVAFIWMNLSLEAISVLIRSSLEAASNARDRA